MLLIDGCTEYEIRDPITQDAWESDLNIRLSRNRNQSPLITQSGPQYLVVNLPVLLSRCFDPVTSDNSDQVILESWVDKYAGQYAEIVLFGTQYTCVIGSSTMVYERLLNWYRVDLQIRVLLT